MNHLSLRYDLCKRLCAPGKSMLFYVFGFVSQAPALVECLLLMMIMIKSYLYILKLFSSNAMLSIKGMSQICIYYNEKH